ncbi:MAG: hypothetical protein WC876_06365 [Candidatus Thermoplasmatota archaeon]|jgi:hypothetical protein
MKAAPAVAGAAALALAAAQASSGALGFGVALTGLVATAAGLGLRARRPASPAGPLVASAGLCLLALWPTAWGAHEAVAWALGAACAAGLLAVAPATPAQHDRLPARDWMRANLRGLLLPATLLALFVAAPLLVRGLSDPAFAHGVEWRTPYGPLLAALPILALAGAMLLAGHVLRSRASIATEGDSE